MATQANITGNSGYSAVTPTGGSSTTWNSRGTQLNKQTGQQIANYRRVLSSDVPLSDLQLSVSSGPLYNKGAATGWKADYRFLAPVMEVPASGDASGFVAGPSVAASSSVRIIIERTDRMTDNDLDNIVRDALFILQNDATLRAAYKSHDVIS